MTVVPDLEAPEEKRGKKKRRRGEEEADLLEGIEPGNFNVWVAQTVIRAIGRGFNPKKALKLVNEEFLLEIIDLEAVLGKSRKRITRMKGRIIGEAGKMRRALEEYTKCDVSVLGDTVALIGTFEGLKVARRAVSMLLEGASHKSVISFLRKKLRERKEDEMKRIWKPSF
ncbi:MAG: hypothetical protein Kow0069_01290 [Promethearchaeota archaeon]